MGEYPSDYGFRKVRGGHRWEEWEGHGYRAGYELVDEGSGEWVAYLDHENGESIYRDAWSKAEALREATLLAAEASRGPLDVPQGFDWTLPGGL